VSSTPKEFLISGGGSGNELRREIALNSEISQGVLHIAAKGASCDVAADAAQCHIHQQDWGIPIKLSDVGASLIELVLSGTKD